MKWLLFLHALVLLLWTQTAFANTVKGEKIEVKEVYDGIELTCPTNYNFTQTSKKYQPNGVLKLPYKDENSGEYQCESNDADKKHLKIFVKFRTCDNCIELDPASIAGMAIGDVVATCVIGVAVYLFASVVRNGLNTSSNIRSGRQPPRTREPRGASNEHYQSLNFKSPQDQYDELNRKR